MPTAKIVWADNLKVLRRLKSDTFPLIYIDPPFNTQKTQKRKRIKVTENESGSRVGFSWKKYSEVVVESPEYNDVFDCYAEFIRPRLEEAYRVLASNGSLFFHIDYREAHYCKIMLDDIFGRKCFMNEIIWAYDFGARSKRKWPAKHDTIFWYVKDPKNYVFNYDEMDRIPYMAPGLVGKERAARGKTPTDVWWHTIVPTTGKEKTGYPTQKPLGILNRIIKVHSSEGDWVFDFFAGSGTTGEAALMNGRNALLVDDNKDAIKIMKTRLAKWLNAGEERILADKDEDEKE